MRRIIVGLSRKRNVDIVNYHLKKNVLVDILFILEDSKINEINQLFR